MNIIPALEMKGRRASASDCTGNQIVVKYEFVSSESFKCRVCNGDASFFCKISAIVAKHVCKLG